MENVKKKKIIEPILLLLFLSLFLFLFGSRMGLGNMFKTIMYTAHDLLLNTVFFIMAVAVLTGALGGLLSEFGVVEMLNKLLSPLMKPLYNLPGAAAIGIVTTYLSDNPAILSLVKDRNFIRCFKQYQLPLMCNLGTSFGMGLMLTTFMIAQSAIAGYSLLVPALVGNVAAILGSVVSVRIMAFYTKKAFRHSAAFGDIELTDSTLSHTDKGLFERFMDAVLEGGKSGVELGVSIIPGVLIISTFIMMLTYGPASPEGYSGVAYEGIAVLPWLGERLFWVLKFLFGFSSPELIAFPLTSLGSTGAALALVPKFIADGVLMPNDVAVLTAIGMCWSGYLSTHVAMMDSLGSRQLVGKAIFSHTIGGISAGVFAHFVYVLIS
ncbi:membrane protein [Kosmotoga olearia]|uniref:Nucleoside recognition domain protein n=1 Tax=Kosmotoga olearia (strain ATCC BAA-1733 / DSM 21960 / TBF 19.5.1) TaxID=521045 RepID=C5CEJ0_KOSOT|nr:membrane protein [Kosmotoga olearia]ACR79236.1 nucleoside recognition domain protein [Kosmotoga olearia TBF 19.5.1]